MCRCEVGLRHTGGSVLASETPLRTPGTLWLLTIFLKSLCRRIRSWGMSIQGGRWQVTWAGEWGSGGEAASRASGSCSRVRYSGRGCGRSSRCGVVGVTRLNSRCLGEPLSRWVLSGHLEGDAGGIVDQGVFSTEPQKSSGSGRAPQGGQRRKGGLRF